MRLLYAAALFGALGIGEAPAQSPAQDNGERLLRMFEGTCARKPVSGEALDVDARRLGYVHQNGPVAQDDLKRDLDDINFWKLPDQGSNFAIDAYFAGPRAHYEVSCSLRAGNVGLAAFIEALEREMALPGPQTAKSDPETGMLAYAWMAKAEGAKETLEVHAFKNGIVSVTFDYDVIAR